MRMGTSEMNWSDYRGYLSLLRFPVLFFIWATAAFDFRLYMDLTPLGVSINALFFLACVLTFAGFQTRIGFALLSASLFAKMAIFHHLWAGIGGSLALACVILPLGAYFSLDRYLDLRGIPPATEPTVPPFVPLPMPLKVFAVILIAFIIGGPATIQIARINTRIFLHWNMYDAIGVGIINANYYDTTDGKMQSVDFIQALGYKVRRVGIHHNRQLHDLRLHKRERLEEITQQLCATVPHPESLRLIANVATLKQGWQPLYNGAEHICSRLKGEAAS